MAKTKASGEAEIHDIREELAYLRQKYNSLAIRGYYRDCFKQIEDNLEKLYFQERHPEYFHSCLLLHKRCFPSMGISSTYDEYLEKLLARHKIPIVFVELLKGGGKNVSWKADFFKTEALHCREKGDLEHALGYADLMIKVDQLGSGAHLLRGWIFQDLGQTAHAAKSFERAIELNRSNYQAGASLAAVYAKTDPDKALNVVEEAMKQHPGVAALQEVKAKILFGLGRFQEAIACYDEANLLDPYNADLVFGKAAMMEEIPGQELAAVRQYQRVLALNSNHIPTMRRLAQILAQTQAEAALPYISAVVAAHPEDKDACLLMARLKERTGDGQGAVRQYKAYLEMVPDAHEVWASIGKNLLHDSPERAVAYYEKASDLMPDDPDYHVGRGRCYLRMDRREDAISAYKEAITRDKNSAGAHAALGYLYMEEEPKAALGYFETALRHDPENAYYYQAKGELLGKLPGTKPEELLACYNRAVQLDPGNAELQAALGKLLEGCGNIASAIEHYRAAVGLSPSLAEAHFALARLLMDSEPQTALGHINYAIGLNPRNAEYCFVKSRIYTGLGCRLEAVRELRESLADDNVNIDARQELRQLLDGDAPRVAMMYINRALELRPDHPTYLCERAELLIALGETGKALRQFARALEQDETCHRAHFGVGKLSANTPKVALDHMDRAIELAPDEAPYWFGKGKLLALDGSRYPEALACLDKALSLNNHMVEAMCAKARLLEEHGEVFPAIASYRRVLLMDRNHLEARVRMAALFSDLNPQAALRYIDEAIALQPETYSHYIWRGRILHELGRNAEGEEAVRQAVVLGGGREECYYSLALVLHERLPEVAVGYCSKAMVIAPEKADYPLLLGNIYRKMGKSGQAKAMFAEAIRLDPQCHEAIARTAELLYHEKDPKSLEMIRQAIVINGGNATYFYTCGLILLEILPDLPQALECVKEAIRLAPGELRYRETLLDLLKRNQQYISYIRESVKVKKLRRRLEKEEQEARAEPK